MSTLQVLLCPPDERSSKADPMSRHGYRRLLSIDATLRFGNMSGQTTYASAADREPRPGTGNSKSLADTAGRTIFGRSTSLGCLEPVNGIQRWIASSAIVIHGQGGLKVHRNPGPSITGIPLPPRGRYAHISTAAVEMQRSLHSREGLWR
jgi:hypothetical protein